MAGTLGTDSDEAFRTDGRAAALDTGRFDDIACTLDLGGGFRREEAEDFREAEGTALREGHTAPTNSTSKVADPDAAAR